MHFRVILSGSNDIITFININVLKIVYFKIVEEIEEIEIIERIQRVMRTRKQYDPALAR